MLKKKYLSCIERNAFIYFAAAIAGAIISYIAQNTFPYDGEVPMPRISINLVFFSLMMLAFGASILICFDPKEKPRGYLLGAFLMAFPVSFIEGLLGAYLVVAFSDGHTFYDNFFICAVVSLLVTFMWGIPICTFGYTHSALKDLRHKQSARKKRKAKSAHSSSPFVRLLSRLIKPWFIVVVAICCASGFVNPYFLVSVVGILIVALVEAFWSSAIIKSAMRTDFTKLNAQIWGTQIFTWNIISLLALCYFEDAEPGTLTFIEFDDFKRILGGCSMAVLGILCLLALLGINGWL